MTISPRTKLGPYEVVAAIGAGGMGEVYRARDTKLGRDVAIKVLPEELARDKEQSWLTIRGDIESSAPLVWCSLS